MLTQDDGATMFARYAYPPNELGYCGPAESEPLLAAAGHTANGQATNGHAASGYASPSDDTSNEPGANRYASNRHAASGYASTDDDTSNERGPNGYTSNGRASPQDLPCPGDRASPADQGSLSDQDSPVDLDSPANRGSPADQGSAISPDLRRLAERFDGAWCYLELLARGTGLDDPLDRRVVEAYWLGSPLLDRLDDELFARAVTERFADQHGARLSGLALDGSSDSPGVSGHFTEPSEPSALPEATREAIREATQRTDSSGSHPDGRAVGTPPARAHHGYHVFEVYPWTGLLGVGDGQPALSILDQCRIRWGRVLAVDADRAVVRSRPLTWDGTRLALGPPRTELPRWASDGRSLLPRIAPGDRVALHWDWICDSLSEHQLAELRRRTAEQLELTNAGLTPRRWWHHASGHEGRGPEKDQGEGRGNHGPRAVDQRRSEL